ncbi:hypothetical protein ACFL43_02035 [Thermodesulfobacteriota bacterium]
MDALFQSTLSAVDSCCRLEPVAVPPELALTQFPLKALELSCYNWKAEAIYKMYAMRLRVRVPALDVLGMAIYPAENLDAPFFIFDLSCTRKKVVTYINCIALTDSEAYRQAYLGPLQPAADRYRHLPPQRMPAWMCAYRNLATIYSLPERARLPEIKQAVRDYLEIYLDVLAGAAAVTDRGCQAQIASARRTYLEKLRTKDRSRMMLGKIIGTKKANRIFQEVLT